MSVYATIYFYPNESQERIVRMIKRETNLDIIEFAKEEMKTNSYKKTEIQWCNLNTNPITIHSQCTNEESKEED